MIISKQVEIGLSGSNISYYEEKGYTIHRAKDKQGRIRVPRNSTIKVKIEDVPLSGNMTIEAQCDYCLEEGIVTVYPVKYFQYNKSRNIIQKDCCNNVKCMKKKREDSMLKTYGVKFTSQLDSTKIKIKEIMIEKYGVDNISKTDYFKEKYKEVMMKNYGSEYFFQTDIFKTKSKETQIQRYGVINYSSTQECRDKVTNTNLLLFGVESASQTIEFQQRRLKTMVQRYGVNAVIQLPDRKIEMSKKKKITNLKRYGSESPFGNKEVREKIKLTMYKNGTVPCSRQQEYLSNLLNGFLNYPVGNCNLDIAFPSEMIYIEYDGGGHNLSVKLNKISESQFKLKEIRRGYFLKSKGWRMIKIVSIKDCLPQDNIIIEIIKNAKDYLNTGHSWMKYNIDKEYILCSQFERKYDFGYVKRIKIN